MLRHPQVNVLVTCVEKPSFGIQKFKTVISSKWFPKIHELLEDIDGFCDQRAHRIYWRITELDYLPIRDYIGLKGALNLMHEPGLFVVVDPPDAESAKPKENRFDGGSSNNGGNEEAKKAGQVEFGESSPTWELEDSLDGYFSDIQILRVPQKASKALF